MALNKKRYGDLKLRQTLYTQKLSFILKKTLHRTSRLSQSGKYLLTSKKRTSYFYTQYTRYILLKTYANFARVRNFCVFSGLNRSVLVKGLGISRMSVKYFIERRSLVGFRKISW